MKKPAKTKRRLIMSTEKRECGECTECCTTQEIYASKPYMVKDGGTPCEYVCATGCTIYETRPQPCRDFRCAWLAGWGTAKDRPDRSGLVLEAVQVPSAQVIVATEARAGATEERRNAIRLRTMKDHFAVATVDFTHQHIEFFGSKKAMDEMMSMSKEISEKYKRLVEEHREDG